MSKVRVSAFSLSLDGYGAGPAQALEHPLGVGGEALHEWFFAAQPSASASAAGHVADPAAATVDAVATVDAGFAARSMEGIGAWIMGRNMFGPSRGVWPDDGWRGWWGENPPYHVPVFVLTHHPRESFTMEGGTTFHFVTEGHEVALARAREAAQGKDVRIGGGASTIRQYLAAGVIDELHLVVTPVLLGGGEALFPGLDLVRLGYRCTAQGSSPRATHHVLTRK